MGASERAELINVAKGKTNKRFMDILLLGITGFSLIYACATIEENPMRAITIAICGVLNFNMFTYLNLDQRIKTIVELMEK